MNKLAALFLLLGAPGDPQEDREAVRKVYEAVRPSFVAIEIILRKKTRLERAELEEETLDNEAQQLLNLSENQQAFETWGVAVDRDLVLTADRPLRSSDVEKLELTDSTGARFEGKLHAVGRRHDFVLIKASPPKDLVPLAFGDWRAPVLGETFHVTYAERVDGRWHLNVSPYIQTNAPLVDAKDWFCIDVMRPGAVISDKAGATVGVALDQYLWALPDGRSSFLGKAVLADERLADLEPRYEAIRRKLPESIKRIEITFRAERGDDFVPGDDAKAGRTTVFGVTVDDRGTLLVPTDLPRELVRRIEDMHVVEAGARRPCAFVGAFKSFGGMLLRAEGLPARCGAVRDAGPAPTGELFFTALLEDRFGRTRTRVDYNRLFRTEPGLKGAERLQPRRKIKPGSFLLDFEGRPVGFATVDKKEEDPDEVAVEAARERFGDRFRAQYVPDYLRRLVYFGELARVLADPAAHFDAKAVPMSKREEKKLVWLGVEFQELSKPLAEALGVQERDLTNDGRRGLLVAAVYPGSPAQRAGLQVDDILLSVQPEGEFFARDLIAEADRFSFPRGPYGGPRGQAPWKPTRNYLTTMLTEIGAERKVAFQYARGKEKGKVEVTLEYAPRDYETAERHKDESLGFTVKELTYEVRYFQKVDPGLSGVVVSRVESGSRADVAKLPVLSIIRRVNEVEVKDLAHFKDLVASARNLTLTTVSYGQTKLVELTRE